MKFSLCISAWINKQKTKNEEDADKEQVRRGSYRLPAVVRQLRQWHITLFSGKADLGKVMLMASHRQAPLIVSEDIVYVGV